MATKKVGIPAIVTGPDMAEALVAMVEGRAAAAAPTVRVKTARQVENLAKLGLELCKKGVCFFCANLFTLPKEIQRAKKVQWATLPLCPCLDQLRDVKPAAPTATVPVAAPKVEAPVSAETSVKTAPTVDEDDVPLEVIEAALTKGSETGLKRKAWYDEKKAKKKAEKKPVNPYVQIYPWQDLQDLAESVKSGTVKPSDPMYKDECCIVSCKKPFTITAGIILKAHAKNGKYTKQRKCKACAIAAKKEALPKTSHAAVPKRHQKGVGPFGAFSSLTASLGELIGRDNKVTA